MELCNITIQSTSILCEIVPTLISFVVIAFGIIGFVVGVIAIVVGVIVGFFYVLSLFIEIKE